MAAGWRRALSPPRLHSGSPCGVVSETILLWRSSACGSSWCVATATVSGAIDNGSESDLPTIWLRNNVNPSLPLGIAGQAMACRTARRCVIAGSEQLLVMTDGFNTWTTTNGKRATSAWKPRAAGRHRNRSGYVFVRVIVTVTGQARTSTRAYGGKGLRATVAL